MRLFRLTLWVQTMYYLVTALWALVHIESFTYVSGSKTDLWLVKTVAVLLVAISLSFLVALLNKNNNWQTAVLATSCCIGLTAIDCYYAFSGTISKIYLADAAIEILLLFSWIVIMLRIRKA